MQSKEIDIISKDGVKIPAFIYDNDGNETVKGVVIIVHGFGEYSGSYKELAERLGQANYSSVIFDQRGHGTLSEHSPEKRKKYHGIIPDYQSFLDDIDAIIVKIKEQKPDVPIILYGHSMGGNIAANYLLKHRQSDFSCAVLESPCFGLYKEVSPVLSVIAAILGRLSPKIAIINKLPSTDVTSDKTKSDEMSNDPLYHNRISFRMFAGIKKACAYAINNAAQLSIPIYLTYAKNEKIVSNPAIQKFYSSCGSNVIIKEYESYHAIHNDIIREEFYEDMINFLEKYSKN